MFVSLRGRAARAVARSRRTIPVRQLGVSSAAPL